MEEEQIELISLRAKPGDRGIEAGRDRRVRFISLRVKLLVGFTLVFSAVFAAAYYGFYLDKVMVVFVVTYVVLFALVFVVSGTLIRPIVALTRWAERVAGGNYSLRDIPEIPGLLSDEVVILVKIFRQMVVTVADRERDLKEQVRGLTMTMHIQIDQLRKAKKVAEITESAYFQHLQEKARQMRETKGK